MLEDVEKVYDELRVAKEKTKELEAENKKWKEKILTPERVDEIFNRIRHQFDFYNVCFYDKDTERLASQQPIFDSIKEILMQLVKGEEDVEIQGTLGCTEEECDKAGGECEECNPVIFGNTAICNQCRKMGDNCTCEVKGEEDE